MTDKYMTDEELYFFDTFGYLSSPLKNGYG